MIRSIKTQLSLSLMAFAALFMILGGWLVYNQVQSTFYREFDERLRLQALSLTTGIIQERNYVDVIFSDRYLREYSAESSTWFFQIWAPNPLDDEDGPTTLTSDSLMESECLPQRYGELNDPLYWNFELPNGKPGRGIGIQFNPYPSRSIRKAKLPPVEVELVMAQDRSKLDTALGAVAKNLVLAGGLGLLSTVLLVPPLLTKLLRPLRKVSRQTESIDANALNVRFDTSQPEEIRPISLALNGLMERLESSFERERRFVSDIAHELRTPIAEIKSYAELKIKWPDKTEGCFEKEILKMIVRMESLTGNLLKLARMESAQVDGEACEIDLNLKAEECLSQLSHVIHNRKINISQNLQSMETIQTHPDLFHTVLFNLISNAVSHSPACSEVLICSNKDPLSITITNPAPNLTQEDLPFIFDRLWQHDQSRSNAEHHGLGLALAKSCAEALGMNISAHLDPESGLHLTIRI